MTRETVKVLYIAGTGRSGSTILANALGQTHGFFSAGEIGQIWQRGMIENWLCGCGERFRDCPVWKAVIDEAFGGDGGVEPSTHVGTARRIHRIRYVPRVIASQWKPELIRSRLGESLDRLEALYRAIRSVTGCEVIVDSSKMPSYGRVLAMIPALDLSVLHLVRDPRGAAYSWQKRRLRRDGAAERYMDSMGSFKSAALWSIWNTTAELLWARDPSRYLRMRYEDVVQHPRDRLRSVIDFLGYSGVEPPFVGDNRVELGVTHTISGNPSRMERGPVTLRPDLEWQREMSARDRAVVSAITIHSLRRYGYPWWVGNSSPSTS